MASLSSDFHAQAMPKAPQHSVDSCVIEVYHGSDDEGQGDGDDIDAGSEDGKEEGDRAEQGVEEGDDDEEELGIDSGEESDDVDDNNLTQASLQDVRRAGTCCVEASTPECAPECTPEYTPKRMCHGWALEVLVCLCPDVSTLCWQPADSVVTVQALSLSDIRSGDSLPGTSKLDGEAEEGDDGERQSCRAARGALGSPVSEQAVCALLFKGLIVWLAREVPREVLMLLVRAFGGVACWDGPGSPYAEGDEAITHAVVDRPTQAHVRLGRVYVQPQWVFDSANFRVLVPTGDYAPTRKPPPHLSPFIDYAEEGYVPEYAQQLLTLQEAAASARQRAIGQELAGGLEAFETANGPDKGAAAAVEKQAQDETQFHGELAQELGAPCPCCHTHRCFRLQQVYCY
jgi:hypothetical protein